MDKDPASTAEETNTKETVIRLSLRVTGYKHQLFGSAFKTKPLVCFPQLQDLKRELKTWKEEIDKKLKKIEDNELMILSLLREIRDSGSNLNGQAGDSKDGDSDGKELPKCDPAIEGATAFMRKSVYPGSRVQVDAERLDHSISNSKSATIFSNYLMTLMFSVKDVYRRSLTGSKARVKPDQKNDYIKKLPFGTQEDFFNAIEHHFKKSYNKFTVRLHVANHLKNLNKFFQAIKSGTPFTKELVSSCRLTIENLKFSDLSDYIQEPELFVQLDEEIDFITNHI